jgi:hypothetical protein
MDMWYGYGYVNSAHTVLDDMDGGIRTLVHTCGWTAYFTIRMRTDDSEIVLRPLPEGYVRADMGVRI